MPSTPDLSFTGLDEFVNKPVVENCKAKSCEEKTKVVRKNDDASIIKEYVSDNEEEDVSRHKVEKKTVRPSIAKTEFVKPKQQEKTARKTVKQVEQHRVDEGFFIGYSLNSKAFRVFNNKTKILEENLHIRFSESTPNVIGSGPAWLFDIDALTRTTNYEPIVANTQSNGFVDLKSSYDDGSKPSRVDVKKVDEDPCKESECNDQKKKDNVNSTNNVNTICSTVNADGTNEVNADGGIISSELQFDPNMPALEDVSTFDLSRNFEDNGFEDPDFPDKVYKVEKALYGLHQAPRAWFTDVKTTSTKVETHKPLLKDKDGEYVDVHMYRSMIGSLMYLTSSKPDIMFTVCACTRYQVNPKVSNLHAMKRIFSDYGGASLDRKSTTGGCQFLGYGKKIIIIESSVRRDLRLAYEEGIDFLPNSTLFEQIALIGLGKCFSGRVTPLFPTMVVQNQSQLGEGSAMPTNPHHTPTILQPSSSQPQKTQKPRKLKRKDTQVPQPSDPTKSVANEVVHKELSDSLVRAATTASSLEVEQDSGNITKTQSKSTHNESSSQRTNSGGGPRCQKTMGDTTAQTRVLDLEKTKTTQHNEIVNLKRRIESSRDEESVGDDASKQGRIDTIDADEYITLVSVQDDADKDMFDVDALNGEEVFVAGQNENVVEEVVDAAQVSTAVTTVTITTEEITLAQSLEALKTSKPKVKGIVFQDPSKSTTTTTTISSQQSHDKGKGIMIEESKDLQEKEEKANIALIEEWDDIQAKIDADHQLAERMQAQEQEELAFKRVNTFEDFRIELVKGKEMRAGKELKMKYGSCKKDTECWNESCMTPVEYIYAVYADLHLLMKKLDDFEEEYQVQRRIVGIKSLLDAVGITTAQVYVNTALMNVDIAKFLMNHYVDMIKKEIRKFVLAKDWKSMDELMNAALEREQETKKCERSPPKKGLNRVVLLVRSSSLIKSIQGSGGNDTHIVPIVENSIRNKLIRVKTPSGGETFIYGESKKTSLAICTYARAKKHLARGFQAYLAHVVDIQKNTPKIDSIPIVRELPDVFPEELPGIPPDKQVEFCIDLIPGSTPVAKSLYRLAPSEMQELIKQLHELLDKGFIHLSSSRIKVDTTKINAIMNWEQPKTPTEIRSFLGLARIWIPNNKELKNLLLDEAHKSKYSIHPGSTKMYCNLKPDYWWSGMKRDIVKYVEQCLTCLQVKTEHQQPYGKLQPLEIPVWKWEKIIMDLITKLPRTPRQCNVIWVIFDRLTKSAIFLPIKESMSSEALAKLYLREVVARHGVPVSIVSDRDNRFTSRFWQRIQEDLGTRVYFSIAYHPQTDGQSERTIQTLEDLLRACAIDFGGSWDKYLPLAEFSYNNSYHFSIKMPPYEMLYGRKCRTLICWGEIEQRELASSDVVQQTNEKIDQIKERLKMVQDRQKSYADKRRRPIEIQVEDHVPWKGVICFRKRGKFRPRYIGPFRITDRVGKVAYRIELPEELNSIHNTFHVSQLRKCLVDKTEYVLLADIVVDEKLGYVEEAVEILDTMVNKLRRKEILLLKVRWKHRKGLDYSWRPEEELIKYYPAFHQEWFVRTQTE
nr:putative reverse transcriptase domain-containing protein [Tanacetum cinerariifolium]